MKKLFCSVMFAMGVFVAMQAQSLSVQGVNNTTDYSFNLKDANGDVINVVIPNGTFGGGATYAIGTVNFPIRWEATFIATGCSTGQVIQMGPSSGNIPLCQLVGGNSVQYNLQQVFGGNYVLNLTLN
jgi:hypothetical protein